MIEALFTCRTCKKSDFKLAQMKKERTLFNNNKGICKPCHSDYNTMSILNKRAERDPSHYMSCGDCCRTFSKYGAGTPSDNVDKRENLRRKECPFCASPEIEDYQ